MLSGPGITLLGTRYKNHADYNVQLFRLEKSQQSGKVTSSEGFEGKGSSIFLSTAVYISCVYKSFKRLKRDCDTMILQRLGALSKVLKRKAPCLRISGGEITWNLLARIALNQQISFPAISALQIRLKNWKYTDWGASACNKAAQITFSFPQQRQ